MNRFLLHILSGAILAFSLAAPALAQETFAYPDNFPPRVLQTVNGVSNSLAPTGSNTGKSVSLSGNRVVINGGTVSGVYGAADLNDSDAVTGNHVTINGGTVSGNIYGGYGFSNGKDVPATNNSVTIIGGTINGTVYGGVAMVKSSATIIGSGAMNNTVTIRGAPTFGDGARLYGGCALYNGANVIGNDNNTLNLHSAGLTVRLLNAFQNLNFYLPATLTAGGTMLTVTDQASIGVAKINVGLEGAGPTLRTGDRFVLVAARSIPGNIPPTTGVVGGYAYTVQKEGNSLVLTVGDRQSSPGPTRQYTGQWIKVDGNGRNDEDAWGLTVLMGFPGNSRYIFVPWYTYDSTGKASWYIFQSDNWSASDKITADVFRHTGPDWGTMPYDNNRITSAKVGTATLTFTSATKATFQYSVEGASRTINLAPIDNVPLLPSAYTGQWAKVDANGKNDEDAWGLTVLQGFQSNPNYVFVPWYTYDASGKALWYIFQDNLVGNTVSADVYRYTGPNWGTTPYDNSKVTNTKVGTAKLTFTSAITAKFEYNVEGASRTIDLQKLE